MSKLKKYTSPQPRFPDDASRYVVDYMDHAPVWPAVIFAQGLFRPTQNGAPVVPLEIEYETTIQKQRVEYVFRSPETLNIVDQAVFLHLCQLMAAGNRVHLAPDHERYPVYCAALGATGLWSDQGISVVVVKLSDLAHGIGLTRTGTEAYMQEELRAEIFSACLCAELGVATPMDNHAAYVGAWLKKLREDKFEVFRAAKDARRMVDFVMGRGSAQAIAVPASDSAPAMLSADLGHKAVASGVAGLLLRAQQAARRGTSVRRHGFAPVSEVLSEHAQSVPRTGSTHHFDGS